MNLHPLVVHFPIAFLTSYAILEILPLQRWFPRVSWGEIKFFLVVFGVLGAFAALETGESVAAQVGQSVREVVEVHEFFARITTAIFSGLAAAYLLAWADQRYFSRIANQSKIIALIMEVKNFILKRPVAIVLAIVGIAAVTLTGALGGIIAYGPDTDPVTKIVYSIFFEMEI